MKKTISPIMKRFQQDVDRAAGGKRNATFRMHPDFVKLCEMIQTAGIGLTVPLVFGPDPTGQVDVLVELENVFVATDDETGTASKPAGLRLVGGTDISSDAERI
jgi:hypothetical protein